MKFIIKHIIFATVLSGACTHPLMGMEPEKPTAWKPNYAVWTFEKSPSTLAFIEAVNASDIPTMKSLLKEGGIYLMGNDTTNPLEIAHANTSENAQEIKECIVTTISNADALVIKEKSASLFTFLLCMNRINGTFKEDGICKTFKPFKNTCKLITKFFIDEIVQEHMKKVEPIATFDMYKSVYRRAMPIQCVLVDLTDHSVQKKIAQNIWAIIFGPQLL